MARYRMARLFLVALLAMCSASCSGAAELEGDADAAVCRVGETRGCICESGAPGSQACDSFTRTWSVCLCESGWGADAEGQPKEDSVGGIQLQPGDPIGVVSVGGAVLTSPNYELRLVAPATPASDWLESESYRMRLGTSGQKEAP